MVHVIKNEHLKVSVSDSGAEVLSAVGADGHEYIWSGDAWGEHAPLLFPICGRILDGKFTVSGKEYHMSSHGFAKRSKFKLESKTDTRVVFSLCQDEKTLEEYPFDFRLVADYRLDGNKLLADFTVVNTGDVTLPYMFGWHPGFTLPEGGEVESFSLSFGEVESLPLHRLQNGPFVNPSAEIYSLPRGRYVLNDEEIAKNDTLIFRDVPSREALLSGSHTPYRVRLGWSENIPYFCVWKHPGQSVRFICLEPWSDVPADGIVPENFDTRSMSRLSPGAAEVYSYTVDLL